MVVGASRGAKGASRRRGLMLRPKATNYGSQGQLLCRCHNFLDRSSTEMPALQLDVNMHFMRYGRDPESAVLGIIVTLAYKPPRLHVAGLFCS